MKSLDELHQIVASTLSLPLRDVPMEVPPSANLGDVCFSLFKAANLTGKSPAHLAKETADTLKDVEGVRGVTPMNGFLNISLEFSALADPLNRLLEEGKHSFPAVGTGQRVMVEYFSPNTNKPLHIGHLRNLFIGDALSRTLSVLGHTVIRANLYNDRGIHIEKAQLAYERFGRGATPASQGKKGDQFIGEYYVRFGREASADPSLEDEARDYLLRWEAGDSTVVAAWQTVRDWVLQGFGETLSRLNIEPFDTVYFESEFWKHGPDVVRSGLERGVFKEGEEGAIIADVPGIGIRPVLRGDGTALYITQDLYLALRKFKEFGPLDRSVYIVASEQKEHFKMLFAILKQLGYRWADVCYHLGYGMILIKGGKLKSREGLTADADSILGALEQMAAHEIRTRWPSLSDEQVAERAHAIAISVLKWEFLKVNTLSDINFNPESSLSFDGDTGPYLLYTYARMRSVVRRSGLQDSLAMSGSANDVLREEKEIAVLINMFPLVVQKVAAAYNFSILTNHLRLLADRFNAYFQSDVRILHDDKSVALQRVSLTAAAAQTLRQGLSILGIPTLEEM